MSIKSLELKEHPEFLLHVSPLKNLGSIMENGLMAQIGKSSFEHDEEAVWLCELDEKHLDYLLSWLMKDHIGEDLIALKIDTKLAPYITSTGLVYEYYTEKNIPPEGISVYKQIASNYKPIVTQEFLDEFAPPFINKE